MLRSAALADVRDFWAYLHDVFVRFSSGWPVARLGDLLPAAWGERKRQDGLAQSLDSTGTPAVARLSAYFAPLLVSHLRRTDTMRHIEAVR